MLAPTPSFHIRSREKKLLKTIICIYFTYHTIINCTCTVPFTYLVYYRSILFHCILQSLVYMGIRKCVCDILSTIGLHPRAKIILFKLQFTYLFLTHFTWVGNKKYQCTPFFKSLHSNKHFFACQNMYTRLLIQIWPIIKCSFAVCFSEGNSKEISQKCFKFFFDKLPGLWEIQEHWKFLSQDAMQKELRIWKCENIM